MFVCVFVKVEKLKLVFGRCLEQVLRQWYVHSGTDFPLTPGPEKAGVIELLGKGLLIRDH